MAWGRFLLVVVIASVVTTLTDWLFMGVLFHDKYLTTPEMWRSSVANSEPRYIVYSQIIGVITCAAFTALCAWANLLTFPRSLAAAGLVWLAGPAVVLAQMVIWTKLHPLVGLSHALGWLTRLIVTALLAAWLL
ncbi:MAG TPA: hypothetical protein VGI79_20735 [Caulobacteraceae bacterium]|jgi:hypothetical protein